MINFDTSLIGDNGQNAGNIGSGLMQTLMGGIGLYKSNQRKDVLAQNGGDYTKAADALKAKGDLKGAQQYYELGNQAVERSNTQLQNQNLQRTTQEAQEARDRGITSRMATKDLLTQFQKGHETEVSPEVSHTQTDIEVPSSGPAPKPMDASNDGISDTGVNTNPNKIAAPGPAQVTQNKVIDQPTVTQSTPYSEREMTTAMLSDPRITANMNPQELMQLTLKQRELANEEDKTKMTNMMRFNSPEYRAMIAKQTGDAKLSQDPNFKGILSAAVTGKGDPNKIGALFNYINNSNLNQEEKDIKIEEIKKQLPAQNIAPAQQTQIPVADQARMVSDLGTRKEMQDYNMVKGYFGEAAAAFKQYQSDVAAGKKPNQTLDETLLSTYTKMLDPQGTIRNQKVEILESSQDPLSRYIGQLKKMEEGGLGFTPGFRTDMMKQMHDMISSRLSSAKQSTQTASDVFGSYGIGQDKLKPYMDSFDKTQKDLDVFSNSVTPKPKPAPIQPKEPAAIHNADGTVTLPHGVSYRKIP